MKKTVSIFVLVIFIIAVALMSCEKKNAEEKECLCVLVDAYQQTLCEKDIIPDWALIYPNPTSNVVQLFYEGGKFPFTVTITDKRDKVKFNKSCNNPNIVINVADYPEGKYLLTIDNDKQEATFCLFIDRSFDSVDCAKCE